MYRQFISIVQGPYACLFVCCIHHPIAPETPFHMGVYCQYIPMLYWSCPIYLNATKSLSNIFPSSLSNIFSRSLSKIFPCYKVHVQYITMLQGPCATRRGPTPSWSKVKHPESYYEIGVEPPLTETSSCKLTVV